MPLFTSGTTFASLVKDLLSFVSGLVYILVGVAILFFFWGIVKYVRKPSDTKQRTNIMWSLVALFVLVSFVGLVRILLNTIGA